MSTGFTMAMLLGIAILLIPAAFVVGYRLGRRVRREW